LLSFVGATSNHFGVVTFGTMTPVANNYVQLHSDRRDAFGLPLLDIHIQYEPEVRANILSNQSRMRDMFAAAGYVTRLECPVERLTPGASAHYGGAVRMHASPDHGVLNAWNRLYDCDNVVVVDASCFTTGVEKNPTLTVMALAARAAERLARDLKRADVAPLHRLAYAVPAIR
jgi:choline dehydrogenase-like flavoprotein